MYVASAFGQIYKYLEACKFFVRSFNPIITYNT